MTTFIGTSILDTSAPSNGGDPGGGGGDNPALDQIQVNPATGALVVGDPASGGATLSLGVSPLDPSTSIATLAADQVNVTGPLTASSFTTPGSVTASDVTSSGTVTGGSGSFNTLDTQRLQVQGVTQTLELSTGLVDAETVTVAGTLTAGATTVESLTSSGPISAASITSTTGPVTSGGGFLLGNGSFSVNPAGQVQATEVNADSLTATGVVAGQTGTFTTLDAEAVNADDLTAQNVEAQSIFADGSIEAGNFTANSSGAVQGTTFTAIGGEPIVSADQLTTKQYVDDAITALGGGAPNLGFLAETITALSSITTPLLTVADGALQTVLTPGGIVTQTLEVVDNINANQILTQTLNVVDNAVVRVLDVTETLTAVDGTITNLVSDTLTAVTATVQNLLVGILDVTDRLNVGSLISADAASGDVTANNFFRTSPQPITDANQLVDKAFVDNIAGNVGRSQDRTNQCRVVDSNNVPIYVAPSLISYRSAKVGQQVSGQFTFEATAIAGSSGTVRVQLADSVLGSDPNYTPICNISKLTVNPVLGTNISYPEAFLKGIPGTNLFEVFTKIESPLSTPDAGSTIEIRAELLYFSP